jgi:hypothetical protein
LQLERPSAVPDGEARIGGNGCPPSTDVLLTIAGRTVGTARADAGGRFDTEIDLDGFGVGRHLVVASCGGITLERPLDVVVSASLGAGAAAAAAAGAILCFFVLLAFILTTGRGGAQ